MKYLLLFFLSFSGVFSMGQTKRTIENVVITSMKNKTRVHTNENGELLIHVSPKDVRKLKTRGLIRYCDFGARGDGKTDDINAIAAAHAFANQHGHLTNHFLFNRIFRVFKKVLVLSVQ